MPKTLSHYFIEFREQFDWTSEDNTCSATFQVTTMLEDIASGKLKTEKVLTLLDHEWANIALPLRELNIPYAKSLSLYRRDEPVLGIWMPDGSVLLIDGGHRYMARILAGETEIKYHLVAFADWQPYAKVTGNLPK